MCNKLPFRQYNSKTVVVELFTGSFSSISEMMSEHNGSSHCFYIKFSTKIICCEHYPLMRISSNPLSLQFVQHYHLLSFVLVLSYFTCYLNHHLYLRHHFSHLDMMYLIRNVSHFEVIFCIFLYVLNLLTLLVWMFVWLDICRRCTKYFFLVKQVVHILPQYINKPMRTIALPCISFSLCFFFVNLLLQE